MGACTIILYRGKHLIVPIEALIDWHQNVHNNPAGVFLSLFQWAHGSSCEVIRGEALTNFPTLSKVKGSHPPLIPLALLLISEEAWPLLRLLCRQVAIVCTTKGEPLTNSTIKRGCLGRASWKLWLIKWLGCAVLIKLQPIARWRRSRWWNTFLGRLTIPNTFHPLDNGSPQMSCCSLLSLGDWCLDQCSPWILPSRPIDHSRVAYSMTSPLEIHKKDM